MKSAAWKYLSIMMSMILILGTGAVALMPVPVSAADPLEQWVMNYQPGGGEDVATAIAVDGNGNAYVTGYSNDSGHGKDYVTIKYDTDGNEKWVARYDGGGATGDQPDAIAVDSNGNVYVTGASDNITSPASTTDFTTVKYDANGNQQWVMRYGLQHDWDRAYAIGVDSSSNVYVTGSSYNGGPGYSTHSDYATIKYDTNGNQKWVQRYHNVWNDAAYAIAVDSSGNAYVTGVSASDSCGDDCATVKYDTNGTEKWVARYNGTFSGNDYGQAIVVNSSGVYIAGCSQIASGWNDYSYVTLKYDTDGNQKWASIYPEGVHDYAKAIAVDGSGNAFVTGYNYNGTGYYAEYATTLKYDTNGNEKWATQYTGPDGRSNASGIAVDGSGGAYITGYSYNADTHHYDYVTIDYSTLGVQQWAMRYDARISALMASFCTTSIAVNGGDIYVTGASSNGYATVKYSLPEPPPQLPTITVLNPSSGNPGQCPMTVVITGTNLTGATTVSFGPYITVNGFTVNSATQITATICIAAGATTGARNISVTTPAGTATRTGGFTIVHQSIGTGAPTTPHGASGSGPATNNAPVNQPNVVVQSASLSATTVSPNTPVTVTADITNKSTANGSKKVTVYVNGEIETTQGVIVNSGSASQLTFNISRSEPGTYKVYVDGAPAGSFTVEAVTANDTILIVSIAFLATAFVCGLIMLRRRQHTGSN